MARDMSPKNHAMFGMGARLRVSAATSETNEEKKCLLYAWACRILCHGITRSKQSAVFEEHSSDFLGMFWGRGILKGFLYFLAGGRPILRVVRCVQALSLPSSRNE